MACMHWSSTAQTKSASSSAATTPSNLCAADAGGLAAAAALLQPPFLLHHAQRVVLVQAVRPRGAVAAQEGLADGRVWCQPDVQVGAVGCGAQALRSGRATDGAGQRVCWAG